MSAQGKMRRIGWIAALAVCFALYLMLHLKVHAVQSDVVRAEREIVKLENATTLLETEFLTRSSQVQLARWNRVDFGYVAPAADQFLGNERQLASFGAPRDPGAPAPIRLARLADEEAVPDFPKLVSPLTGKPLDDALVEPAGHRHRATTLAVGMPTRSMRFPIGATSVADATR